MSKNGTHLKRDGDAPAKLVRDGTSGRFLTVKGFGSMKGQLPLRRGVDLAKPIWEQVATLDRRSDAKGKKQPAK